MGLTLRKIAKLEAGRHFDRDGLYLELSGTGNGSWLLRYQREGREHWHGLGPLRDFDLDEARQRGRAARQQLRDGRDPIDAKRAERTKAKLEKARSITFEKAARQYFEAHQSKWSASHRQQFLGTLELYAFPKLGDLPVAKIDTAEVLSVLEPIWHSLHVTASRLRGRIEVVLGWASVRGFRQGDNPARWHGHLKEALPSKVVKPVHHRALSYADVPAFVAQLSAHQGTGPKLLEFIILTASRTGEAVGARWKEFDFEEKVWTVPAIRMKGKREHRVPLTARMIALLTALPREGGDDGLVFIGFRPNRLVDKMVLPKLLAAMGHDVTTHGFRSSFRDWAGDRSAFPREVIEAALAHVVGDRTEAAYRRSDALEKRRQLMEAWSVFAGSPQHAKGGDNVTPLHKVGV